MSLWGTFHVQTITGAQRGFIKTYGERLYWLLYASDKLNCEQQQMWKKMYERDLLGDIVLFVLYILHFQWLSKHFESIIINSLQCINGKLITTITSPNPILSNYNLIHWRCSLWAWIKSWSNFEDAVIFSKIVCVCACVYVCECGVHLYLNGCVRCARNLEAIGGCCAHDPLPFIWFSWDRVSLNAERG